MHLYLFTLRAHDPTFLLRSVQLFYVYVEYHYVTHFLLRALSLALSQSVSLFIKESKIRAHNLNKRLSFFPQVTVVVVFVNCVHFWHFLHTKIFRFQVDLAVRKIFTDAYVCTYIPVYTLRYVFVCLCVFVSILIVCWFVRVVPGFFFFVYLTVRFVCGGLISICLSARNSCRTVPTCS